MIRMIIGGIGSGKSCSAIHEMLSKDDDVLQYSNFPLYGAKHIMHKRLEVDNIVETYDDPNHKKPQVRANFAYWRDVLEKHDRVNIVIDEAHNVLHARRSQTKWNVIFTEWLVQIRKILGENEDNHLTFVTQRSKALDVVARDLCNQIVFVKKFVDNSKMIKTKTRYRGKIKTKLLPSIYIIKHYFNGRHCIDKYEAFLNGHKTYDARSTILANNIFVFYESYGLIDFGSGVYV